MATYPLLRPHLLAKLCLRTGQHSTFPRLFLANFLHLLEKLTIKFKQLPRKSNILILKSNCRKHGSSRKLIQTIGIKKWNSPIQGEHDE